MIEEKPLTEGYPVRYLILMPKPDPRAVSPHPLDLPLFQHFPRNRSWKGKWIWSSQGGDKENSYRLFRHTFEAGEDHSDLQLLIAATTQYRLWFNGQWVADGPALSADHHTYYEPHDLAHYAKAGTNTLAILVRTVRLEWGQRGGLLMEVLDGDRLVTATGSDWKTCHPGAWTENSQRFRMNIAMPFQEHCDLRQLPPDWVEENFDDQSWEAATVLTGRSGDCPPTVPPWTNLVPRDIPRPAQEMVLPAGVARVEECLAINNRCRWQDLSPSLSQAGRPLEEARVEDPEALCHGRDACLLHCSIRHQEEWFDGVFDPVLLLDFGREVTACIELEVTGPEGTILEIGTAERLFNGHFNNAIEGEMADSCTLREGRNSFRTLSRRAFRYLRLRVRNAFTPVRLHRLVAFEDRYPFAQRGAFHSSDRDLEGIFEICRETLRLCAVDALVDTPWRETAQWLGDVAAVTTGGIHACYGESRLTSKFIRQAGANFTPGGLLSNLSNCNPGGGDGIIPDYSLWWIYGLWKEYQYTGDESFLRPFYPQMHLIFQWHLRYLDDEGFLHHLPRWVFVDWANVDKDGSSAPYNALFAGVLEIFQQIATKLEDYDTQRWTGDLLRHFRSHYADRFYDPNRGVVVDSTLDGVRREKVSEHANASAIAYRLLPAEIALGILERAYAQGQRDGWVECQPFYTKVVLDALTLHHRRDLALQVIRDRWGRRFLDAGLQSCGEEWTVNGTYRSGQWQGTLRTISHAWSAVPAEWLLRSLPGLTLLEPGGRRVSLNPYEGDFSYQLTSPLPHGEVTVSYQPGEAPQIKATGEIQVVN